MDISNEIIALLDPADALKFEIVPMEVDSDYMRFYVKKREDLLGFGQMLSAYFGTRVDLVPLAPEDLGKLLNRYYKKEASTLEGGPKLVAGKLPSQFLETLLREAFEAHCSDIHLETGKDRARIRFRIHGGLVVKYHLDPTEYRSWVNRIKIMAHLDIAEQRLPQDGRIELSLEGKKLDLRVSTLPGLHGEKVVLRLLGVGSQQLSLDTLGMPERVYTELVQTIKRTNGIVLISGPTGSGKTTTLYSALNELNIPERNIVTVEDPVEYQLPGVHQVQIRDDIGLTFAGALRSILRQDPDIIMVGEIRDLETAQIAVRAALTGHLVLSTIHTNSAWETINRLKDMGVPAYLLASSINLSMAQRLVRILCSCKEPQQSSQVAKEELLLVKDLNDQILYRPKGCSRCNYTGFSHRMAIFESMPITSQARAKILSMDQKERVGALPHRTTSLSLEVTRLLLTGQTSLSEAIPIILDSYE